METHYNVIIEAFKTLKGKREIKEISEWVKVHYGAKWKDTGTTLADMVPVSLGGSISSNVPKNYRVLKRVSKGVYSLIGEKE
ncbi:hypothetical protein [Fictibacillus barbaricus]|uniref:HTH HARE-type domain-containing protein n=1 Tax=Fictibacillus barbaricus TaxID=182136 RepID=A0ABU1U5L3_9BACL|nr:hypothetical protein [Fictibacillus barbaricus]MDR7074748.1 hypothetical protein [Fictibacillus barbaricus]